MTRLSVNINKIATLRNARGESLPDPIEVACDLQKWGAEGITVHPRPDERHIRRTDVFELKKVLEVDFNIEGYPGEDFLALIEEVRPEQVTLVPDPPHVITSNAGWKVKANMPFLQETISRLHKIPGTKVSIFVDPLDYLGPQVKNLPELMETGTDRIELYTYDYAHHFQSEKGEQTLENYAKVAEGAFTLGLEVNAGHDLNTENLPIFSRRMPFLYEVSIGHAFISDALYMGLEQTLHTYQACLNRGPLQ